MVPTPGLTETYEDMMISNRNTSPSESDLDAEEEAYAVKALIGRTAWWHKHGLTDHHSEGLPTALLHRFNIIKHECLTARKWAPYRSLVNQAIGDPYITNAVSLGLASICGNLVGRRDCEVWLQELALFMMTVDISMSDTSVSTPIHH